MDRAHGYRATLAMDAGDLGGSEFTVPLAQELRPLIEAALLAR